MNVKNEGCNKKQGISLPRYPACFVCGNENPHGLRILFHLADDHVFTCFTPKIGQMGYPGITHGGVLASLLDETMGWAPCAARHQFCVSTEIKIEYLQPVPIGQQIIVEGRVKELKKKLCLAEGIIRDEKGTLYARGEGKYLFMGEAKTEEVMSLLVFDDGSPAHFPLKKE
jgi:uncharacterized protein (TIGR00369 family)